MIVFRARHSCLQFCWLANEAAPCVAPLNAVCMVMQVVEMGSLGDVQSALAAEVKQMRARSAAQEDEFCDTIAELQAQVTHWCT